MKSYLIAFLLTIFVNTINPTIIQIKKTQNSENKQVISYGDIHYGDTYKTSGNIIHHQIRQIGLHYEGAQKLGLAEFFLDATLPDHRQRANKIQQLFFNAARFRHDILGLHFPDQMQEALKAIFESLCLVYGEGNSDEQLLFRLAEVFSKREVNCVGDGNALVSFHNLLFLIALLPLCRGTSLYASCMRDLADIKLSLHEYFELIMNFVSNTKEVAHKVNKLVKHKENKNEIIEFIQRLNTLEQTIHDAIALMNHNVIPEYANFVASIKENVFKGIYLYSEHVLQELLPLLIKPSTQFAQDLFGVLLTEGIHAIAIGFSAPEILNWFVDIYVLEKILSPNAPQYSFIVMGISHTEHINKVILRENFQNRYDSFITLTDNRMVSNFQEAMDALTSPFAKNNAFQNNDILGMGIAPISGIKFDQVAQENICYLG